MKKDSNFIVIGTPMPQLDTLDEKKRKFQPIWKQEVRDEKGRKRFHGAFTGGFSAGYFNTVGSVEGFTPTSFVSSRSKRAEKVNLNVEHYMDDEDLKEIEENKEILPKATFGEGGNNEDVNLLFSVDTIGNKLMRLMGWDEEELKEEKHLIEDFKNNKVGLGYEIGEEKPKPKAIKTKQFSNGGFGVGAFEEEDEDIYENQKEEAPQIIFKKPKPKPQDSLQFLLSNSYQHFIVRLEVKEFSDDENIDESSLFNPFHKKKHEKLHLNQEERGEFLGEKKNEKNKMFVVSRQIALAALNGFIPYESDLQKQHRYKLFLECCAHGKEDEALQIDENERMEFSKAAFIYRPLSSSIAARFQSVGSSDSPVNKTSEKKTVKQDTDICAASYNIFAKGLTRNTVPWIPVPLLCKRFNVPYHNTSKDDSDE